MENNLEFKGTKKVYAVEYAGVISMNDAPFYDGKNVLDMSDVGVDTAQANAKLYVAAPELLEALQKALELNKEFLNEIGHDPSVGINNSDLVYSINASEQAIEKALK